MIFKTELIRGDDTVAKPNEEWKDKPFPKPKSAIALFKESKLGMLKNAWVAPDGKIIEVNPRGHVSWAEENGFTEEELENRGWVKLTDGEWVHAFRQRLRTAQRNTILKLYAEEGIAFPIWLNETG